MSLYNRKSLSDWGRACSIADLSSANVVLCTLQSGKTTNTGSSEYRVRNPCVMCASKISCSTTYNIRNVPMTD